MNEEPQKQGTCELVVHCYECKAIFQLNPQMIAMALATKASIWEIYEYILDSKCRACEEK